MKEYLNNFYQKYEGIILAILIAVSVFFISWCLFTDIQNISFFLYCGTGYCKEYLIDSVAFHTFQDVVASAFYGDAVYVPAPFIGVIIYDTAHFICSLSCMQDIPQDHPACPACTDQQDLLRI